MSANNLAWRNVTELRDGDKVAALIRLRPAPWGRGQLDAIAQRHNPAIDLTVVGVDVQPFDVYVTMRTASGETELTRHYSRTNSLPVHIVDNGLTANVDPDETDTTNTNDQEV